MSFNNFKNIINIHYYLKHNIITGFNYTNLFDVSPSDSEVGEYLILIFEYQNSF